MSKGRRFVIASVLCVVAVAAHTGCPQRAEVSRWTETGESRAALLGLEELQAALDGPEMRDRIAALDEHGQIRHVLPDGAAVLLIRERGRLLAVIDDHGVMPEDATDVDMRARCLALDMDGDGSLDRTIDYVDLTGDGRVDQMVLTHTVRSTWGERPFLVVVRDLDDGPLSLWSLHDYEYIQRLCQWDSDFGGDGWFAMFRREADPSGGRWVATLEAPFCFYDLDGDTRAEEAVRLIAEGTTLLSARYSINADNDRTEGQLYDYDVSVTALGSVEVPAETLKTLTHRSGDAVGPFLRREDARRVVREANWDRSLLIWDENDHNVSACDPDRERWEGILNAAWRGFPQEGGPPTLTANKRFELDADHSGRMRLYWWAADARLHLLGAEQGAIEVDYNYDGTPDLHIEYADTGGDGYFDRRTISYPGTDIPDRRIDGPLDYAIPGGSGDDTTIPLDYEAIAPFWPREMARRSHAAAGLLAALEATAARLGLPFHRDPLDFYESATEEDFAFIERLRDSEEARRYYREVALELAFAHLIADARAAGAPAPEIDRLLSARGLCDAGHLDAARLRILAVVRR